MSATSRKYWPARLCALAGTSPAGSVYGCCRCSRPRTTPAASRSAVTLNVRLKGISFSSLKVVSNWLACTTTGLSEFFCRKDTTFLQRPSESQLRDDEKSVFYLDFHLSPRTPSWLPEP